MEALHMPHFNLLMNYCNLWLFFILSLTCFSSFCGACDHKPFHCGGRLFEYPFGRRNSGCGDPLLQLQCENKNTIDMPLLDIDGTQFYILDSSTSNSSLLEGIMITIIDKNPNVKECDLSLINSMHFPSSDQLRIVGRYRNITLSGRCKDDANESKCSHTYGFCSFKIKWTPSSFCEHCMLKKGICAYKANTTSNTFFCKGGGKSINSALLRCSIAGGSVAAVFSLVIFIYYVKRRRAEAIRGVCGINNYHGRTDMEAAVGNLSIFTYEELKHATNCFHQDNELGDGGFGTVYLGILQDGRTVAVKRLYQQNPRRMEQFINEVKILSSLHHPNLVHLYGCTCPESTVLLLVYEFVPNGTLADHLHGSRRTPKGLAWEIRLNIAIETAQALSFLHNFNPPIFHRDVKSSNILLDENYRTKVADFGLSRLVPVDVTHVTTAPQGTPGYLDPEYHECFQLTEKSDVYSFGVVLVELISAKLPVDITRNRNEISLAKMAIEKIREGALHELVDPDLKTETNHEVKAMVSAVAELAFGCLAGDRDFRPDMKEVAERLEDIRLRHARSECEQQNSVTKEYSTKMPLSPTSVQETWPSMASDKSVCYPSQD